MDRSIGNVTVVIGDRGGRYPHGNSLVIRGGARTAVVDPSLVLHERAGEFRGQADLVLLSHVHEDHVAGLGLFPGAEVRAHRHDLLGIHSVAGLDRMYGGFMPMEALEQWLVGSFHYAARPDALAFDDGDVFDLGESRVRVHHLPGHTRGHSALLVEPEGVLFLGDIDLTGFGPYYGDAWSDLDDFEESMRRVADIPARAWVSFHQVGVVDDEAVFREKLARFRARVSERDEAILGFLAEPRTMAAMVAHRFLYPPHASMPFIDAVEERTLAQHLARAEARGLVARDGDHWRRA